MTNDEKAEELVKKHIFDSNHHETAMEMAQWKEQQMIEKAAEWLLCWLTSDHPCMPITNTGIKEFINDFKKAMEE